MNEKSIVILADRRFTGHANVARGYANVLHSVKKQADFRAIDPEKDLLPIAEKMIPGSTLVQSFIPPLLTPAKGLHNVALVFHEWSRMPAQWIRALEGFDQVWVSSRYNEDVLRESGYQGRIRYIPAYLNLDDYQLKTDHSSESTFRFLSVGEWHFRKGFHLLAEAFERAFDVSSPVELHIKTSSQASFSFSNEKIVIRSERLSDEEMKRLYADYDAYISTSLAEGLGLPVAEAMASALPVLAPGWSGLTEFCNDKTCMLLPHSLSQQPYCSRPDFYAPGQQCALVDLDKTADLMKEMVHSSPKKRGEMAKAARQQIMQRHSAERVAEYLLSELTNL
jgi:glycosyltransferase involved in cell wall biosynthesis